MVYQEQVMRLAADLAGFTLGEADTLRKAMGKKDRELMAQQREKFIAGCKAQQDRRRKAERIWELIEKFAGYGFNKCLTADTWIEMADGSRKPITEVRERRPGAHQGRPVPGARACGRAACGRWAGSPSPTGCRCAAPPIIRSSRSAAG